MARSDGFFPAGPEKLGEKSIPRRKSTESSSKTHGISVSYQPISLLDQQGANLPRAGNRIRLAGRQQGRRVSALLRRWFSRIESRQNNKRLRLFAVRGPPRMGPC